MEVTHVNHLDTHAIIGGGDVQTFSTKQDAEFFEILSSTLYSNKKLAVVREVLCNSWDANIEGGKENKPVIVEITDNKMTFKDVGPGIPKDMMGDIYCTYGGSTKRHDGKKTGGFGLGSKAPFAYAKNFTVTTVNNGIKSVFNISRGTSATNGVPDLRCMVSVPTTEPSGLTVSIPIQKQDREEFETLVRNLAFMGGMLVRLNDKLLKRVNYNTEMPFILVPTSMFPAHLNANSDFTGYHSERKIKYFVKYGAVVYPIPEEFTANRYIAVETGTSLVRTQNLAVIFLAPPDSIGITPSRETLSMTDKTVETLKVLFSASNAMVKKHVPKVTEKLKPLYKACLEKDVRFWDSSYKALYQMVKDPASGYAFKAKQVSRDLSIHMESKVINSEDLLVEHLVFEYSKNGWGYEEIGKALLADDPDATIILAQIKAALIKSMPLFGEQLFTYALTGGSVEKHLRDLEVKAMKHVARLMKNLEGQGAEVFIQVRGYNHDHYSPEKVVEIANEKQLNLHYTNSRNERIVSKLLYDTKIKNLRELPIYVTQSVIAVDRVIRDRRKQQKYDAEISINVVVRKKKEFARIRDMLKDLWKMTNVWDIQNMDMLAKPAPVEHKDYVLYYEKDIAKARPRLDHEKAKYYCFYPASYLIPGVEGEKLNQKKIQLDSNLGRVMTYLFPGIVLVPGLAEAQKMEDRGLVNVFKAMADEVEEYFLDPNNHQLLLNNLQEVRGYFRSYHLGQILRYVTPTSIMEALGRKPVYIHDDREIPTLIVAFFDLLAKNYSPKYGMQYVQRAADRTKKIFDDFFGNEVNAIIEDKLMIDFIQHLPSAHGKENPDMAPIYRNAIIAAIQSVVVHQHLKKRVPL